VEVIRDKYHGRAAGLVQTGWSVGWGTAALLYTLLSANLPEALTWKVMFWIGLAPAALVFWIRRFVQEPPIQPHTAAGAGRHREGPSEGSVEETRGRSLASLEHRLAE
jgi:MFS family permease